mgnify:CR=1 FL=1
MFKRICQNAKRQPGFAVSAGIGIALGTSMNDLAMGLAIGMLIGYGFLSCRCMIIKKSTPNPTV